MPAPQHAAVSRGNLGLIDQSARIRGIFERSPLARIQRSRSKERLMRDFDFAQYRDWFDFVELERDDAGVLPVRPRREGGAPTDWDGDTLESTVRSDRIPSPRSCRT